MIMSRRGVLEQQLTTHFAAAALQSAACTWFADAADGTSSLPKLVCEIIFVGQIDPHASQFAGPSFALACCIFSFLLVMLDIWIFFIRERSMFQLEYRLRHGLGLLVAFPVAASIVGLLGFFLDLLQPTRAAGIAVGVAWPVFLTAFFNTKEAMSLDEDTEAGGEALA